MAVKAYKVEWLKKPGGYNIVAGEEASKVRYSQYLDIKESYEMCKLTEVRITRLPEYDKAAQEHWEKMKTQGRSRFWIGAVHDDGQRYGCAYIEAGNLRV